MSRTLTVLRISLGRRVTVPKNSLYLGTRRGLATHRETPASSLLSQTLDRASNRAGSGSTSSNGQVGDTVGPFNLPIRPNSATQTKQKPWAELSTSGKVARGTARTTNLTVILLGGALTCVLAYALATELFAKNSPTRLYDDACQKVLNSPQVAQHLKGPLRFHTNAPSYNAPRHRARHVSSQLAVDQSGNEHLLLHFFVESTHPDESYMGESSFSLSDLSLPSAYEWSKGHASRAFDASKSAFAYLVGSNTPPREINTRPPGSSPTSTGVRHTDIGKSSTEGSSAWSFAGLFGGIRTTNVSTKKAAWEPAAQFTEGEVHADLVKDESGDFKYRYLLVDLPHSRSQKATRVYVHKGLNFREGEGVFIWG
ncbi:hypothetical protein FRB97_000085 [Tulasnella sp. 331]|nr:hypothetical protein FRB97_000085 [Tulasnella sp. 331]